MTYSRSACATTRSSTSATLGRLRSTAPLSMSINRTDRSAPTCTSRPPVPSQGAVGAPVTDPTPPDASGVPTRTTRVRLLPYSSRGLSRRHSSWPSRIRRPTSRSPVRSTQTTVSRV
ncbi:hypothetical protein [Micromonospora sp. 4G55]|uniref:hypothetical protein n=1 Tax=Micromonospora sp. 4G55 TaxID=2806102 RepID=UPI001EE411FF|nr:hypothetical protein [Micromonospora sp. 4G55]